MIVVLWAWQCTWDGIVGVEVVGNGIERDVRVDVCDTQVFAGVHDYRGVVGRVVVG